MMKSKEVKMYSLKEKVFHSLKKDFMGIVGLIIVLAVILVAIFAPYLAPYSPTVKDQARLLETEEIEILDNRYKPKKIIINRYSSEHDMTALLRRGLTTTSAGDFFFIPYLLQLSSHSLLESAGKVKISGIPRERLALGMIFESLFGNKVGVRSLDSISRADFALLSGLPFLPSPST